MLCLPDSHRCTGLPLPSKEAADLTSCSSHWYCTYLMNVPHCVCLLLLLDMIQTLQPLTECTSNWLYYFHWLCLTVFFYSTKWHCFPKRLVKKPQQTCIEASPLPLASFWDIPAEHQTHLLHLLTTALRHILIMKAFTLLYHNHNHVQ